ncbi:MAG: hypothetical protein CM1200mP18_00040 [Gammaproteobacteria bacterium]|nr:MAG: hypothetical protein CM1200mP18_00040 [Gammaproteobacteria bacterium]
MHADNPFWQTTTAGNLRNAKRRCISCQNTVVRHLITDGAEDLLFECHTFRHGFNDEITRRDN